MENCSRNNIWTVSMRKQNYSRWATQLVRTGQRLLTGDAVLRVRFYRRMEGTSLLYTSSAFRRSFRVGPTLALAASALIAGCSSLEGTKDLPRIDKALERGAYEELVGAFSKYCGRLSGQGKEITSIRTKLTREIRQRGINGPPPPHPAVSGMHHDADDGDVNALDRNTRFGRGPIVMVYCKGDRVPEDVWKSLDRVKVPDKDDEEEG